MIELEKPISLPLTQENVRKVVEYAEKMEGTEAKGDSPMKGADYSQSTKEGCATSSPANPAPSSVLSSEERNHTPTARSSAVSPRAVRLRRVR